MKYIHEFLKKKIKNENPKKGKKGETSDLQEL